MSGKCECLFCNNPSGLPVLCYSCEKPLTKEDQKVRQCACKKVFFCKRECETEGWKWHRWTCNKNPNPLPKRGEDFSVAKLLGMLVKK